MPSSEQFDEVVTASIPHRLFPGVDLGLECVISSLHIELLDCKVRIL